MLASDKHSSLLWCSISNKEKKHLDLDEEKDRTPERKHPQDDLISANQRVHHPVHQSFSFFFFATPAPAKFARMLIAAN
jgi:hypothetical protein